MNGEIQETKIYLKKQEINLEKLTRKQKRRRLQKMINSNATSRDNTENTLNQIAKDNEDRVARAARGLCRKILGYKGKLTRIL
jgi:DNA anti-recombination protein RmuC